MPTNSRVFLKPFIGGLNTEGSDTDDMVLNTSDELNCTILPEQMRGRRYGFNIEKDGKWIESGEEIIAHSLYHWNNVYDDVNYVVVQINRKLYIFPDVKPISTQDPIAVMDLEQYATLNITEPLSITSVTSSLFVVGRWITPIVIEAVPNTTEFNVVVNNPKFRDFNGVEDGYAVDYLPTTMTSRHLYNLINQGWDKEIFNPTDNSKKTLLPSGVYNGLFYEDYAAKYGVGCYPANNMQWFIGKQNSGEYNTTDVLNTYFGNTPAPKGHFIIDYLNRDRSAVSGIELDDEPAQPGVNYDITLPVNNSEGWAMMNLFELRLGATTNISESEITITPNYKISYSLPTNASGVLTKFSWGLKDDCKNIGLNSSTDKYYRQNVEDMNRTDSRIVDHYIFSQPFTMSLIGVTGSGTEVVISSEVIQPTGKMFSARSWDFTVTNTTSYTRYEIRITWPDLDRSHKWIVPDTLVETLVLSEINYDETTEESYEGLPSSDLLRGAITDIESFGGRLFYLCGSTVLFSQTLSTNNKNYDKCYQDADPTSEEVSDIIATDGGMIQLLSLGRGKALKSFYRGVLVFGDEEVTGILSNSINLFTAESYDVVKITSAGLSSKYSVVETDSNVFYWSNHGIYMVGIDENNNISSVCISLNTIQNWYNNLSQFSRDNCVGYYDYANNRIYWFYPTTNVADKLDGCLVYDLTFNCFMPQYVDSGKVVRDEKGSFEGILGSFNNSITRSGKTYQCYVEDGTVYSETGETLGRVQDKYLTDCQESSTVYEIEPTVYLRAGGNRVVAGDNKVLVKSGQDAGFNRKSAGLFLISDGTNFSFGDFNDREFRDWDVSPYESYLVSRPITLGDTYWNKQTPVMQTLFKRTEEYKLKDIVNTDTVYRQAPIVYNISGQDWTTYVHVFNTGLFKEATANINLSGFNRTLNLVSCVVYGFNGTNFIQIGRTDKYNVEPVSSYSISVECDEQYATTSFSKFKMFMQVHAYDPITGVMPTCTTSFKLERTDMTEGKYVGMVGKVYSGTNSMTKTSSSRYSLKVDTHEDAIFNWVDVTYAPIITTFFPFPEGAPWSGTGSFTAEGGIDLGVSESLSNTSYILHGDNYDNPNIYNSWSIFMDGLTAESGGVLKGIIATYNIGVWVPKFEATTVPVYAKYTTPSSAIIRMRWGWSLNPLSNRWDMMQNGYRPQKDFLHDDYVESRLHIRGRGKAFQIEIRNDDNRDFRLTGLNIITRSPQ